MEMNFYNQNLYFGGYKSSKYMERSYTTNTLLSPETTPDNLPDNINLDDKNSIYGYSKNRLKNLYNYFGLSKPETNKQAKDFLEGCLATTLQRVSGSGVDASNLDMLLRLIEDKKLSLRLILQINKDFHVAQNVSDDLDKLYMAYIENKNVQDVFVPRFNDDNSAVCEIGTGDVCIIEGDRNISVKMPDGTLKKLFITPETYLELFPPVERFIINQDKGGDCYLLSALDSINQNPASRYKIIEMFRQNPDDTVDVVFGGFKYEGKDGAIVQKEPSNIILEDIAAKIPDFRKDRTVSSTTEGIRAIEVLNEYERRKFHLECTEIMYEDFKQNGLNAKICSVRQYSEDEIKHFMSYIDKNGLDSMFCLQDYSAHKKFTLQRNEIEQKLSSLKQNEDEISEYKVLILERWLDSLDRTGAPCYDIFGETLPKEFIFEFFKDIDNSDLYCNNAGKSYQIFEKFGFDIVKKDAYIFDAKEELFSKNPEEYVFTCRKNLQSDDDIFLANHSYSLCPVDIEQERKFSIKNPHNSMDEIILTYNELLEHFDYITVAKI